MKRRRDKKVVPLTGTSSRMKSLPTIAISSLEFHKSHIPEAMRSQPVSKHFSYPETENRKCVYTYEDKYTFARILSSDSLVFDSHFESGNLQAAYRVLPTGDDTVLNNDKSRHIYDLYMHNDVNTNGHTQWFYFSVSNTRAGQEVTFCLRNYAKLTSLFNQGMRPLVLSTKSGAGWVRCGTDISYLPGNIPNNSSHQSVTNTNSNNNSNNASGGNGSSNQNSNNNGSNSVANGNYNSTASNSKSEKSKSKSKQNGNNSSSNGHTFFTMTFNYVFEHTSDVCYFAYCHPYTYTDLQNYLYEIQRKALHCRHPNVRRTTLCKTIAGNVCDLLTVTAPAASMEDLLSRPAIVVTARVHPGETNGSWMMQGFLDFLLGDSIEAEQLRYCFVFKIVPMLNPDGVINGNYRTSLSGSDLNRHWGKPDKLLHPTIYHTKEMIRRLKQFHSISAIVDLHGHSHKEGIFLYGCLPDKRLLRINPPILAIGGSGGNSTNADESSSYKDNSKLSTVVGGSGQGQQAGPNERTTSQEVAGAASSLSAQARSDDSKDPAPATKGAKPTVGSIVGLSNVPQNNNYNDGGNGYTGMQSSASKSYQVNSGIALDASNGSTSTNMNNNSNSNGNGNGYSAGGVGNASLPGGQASKGNNTNNNNNNSNNPAVPASNRVVSVPAPTQSPKDVLAWRVRFMPRVLSLLNPSFDIQSCSFRMLASKAATMRIVMFIEFGIDCSYTLEASLGGKQGFHFGVTDLLGFGRDLGLSFLEMYPLCTSKPRPIFRRDDAFAPVADMKTKASVVDPANQHIFFDNVETESIDTLRAEAISWKKYFNPDICGFANAADFSGGDDSDASSAEGDINRRTGKSMSANSSLGAIGAVGGGGVGDKGTSSNTNNASGNQGPNGSDGANGSGRVTATRRLSEKGRGPPRAPTISVSTGGVKSENSNGITSLKEGGRAGSSRVKGPTKSVKDKDTEKQPQPQPQQQALYTPKPEFERKKITSLTIKAANIDMESNPNSSRGSIRPVSNTPLEFCISNYKTGNQKRNSSSASYHPNSNMDPNKAEYTSMPNSSRVRTSSDVPFEFNITNTRSSKNIPPSYPNERKSVTYGNPNQSTEFAGYSRALSAGPTSERVHKSERGMSYTSHNSSHDSDYANYPSGSSNGKGVSNSNNSVPQSISDQGLANYSYQSNSNKYIPSSVTHALTTLGYGSSGGASRGVTDVGSEASPRSMLLKRAVISVEEKKSPLAGVNAAIGRGGVNEGLLLVSPNKHSSEASAVVFQGSPVGRPHQTSRPKSASSVQVAHPPSSHSTSAIKYDSLRRSRSGLKDDLVVGGRGAFTGDSHVGETGGGGGGGAKAGERMTQPSRGVNSRELNLEEIDFIYVNEDDFDSDPDVLSSAVTSGVNSEDKTSVTGNSALNVLNDTRSKSSSALSPEVKQILPRGSQQEPKPTLLSKKQPSFSSLSHSQTVHLTAINPATTTNLPSSSLSPISAPIYGESVGRTLNHNEQPPASPIKSLQSPYGTRSSASDAPGKALPQFHHVGDSHFPEPAVGREEKRPKKSKNIDRHRVEDVSSGGVADGTRTEMQWIDKAISDKEKGKINSQGGANVNYVSHSKGDDDTLGICGPRRSSAGTSARDGESMTQSLKSQPVASELLRHDPQPVVGLYQSGGSSNHVACPIRPSSATFARKSTYLSKSPTVTFNQSSNKDVSKSAKQQDTSNLYSQDNNGEPRYVNGIVGSTGKAGQTERGHSRPSSSNIYKSKSMNDEGSPINDMARFLQQQTAPTSSTRRSSNCDGIGLNTLGGSNRMEANTSSAVAERAVRKPVVAERTEDTSSKDGYNEAINKSLLLSLRTALLGGGSAGKSSRSKGSNQKVSPSSNGSKSGHKS